MTPFDLPSSKAYGTSCRENIRRSLYAASDGTLSPCIYVNLPAHTVDPQRRVFGNIKEQGLMQIWQSEDFQRFRECLACSDPDLPCRNCPKRFMK